MIKSLYDCCCRCCFGGEIKEIILDQTIAVVIPCYSEYSFDIIGTIATLQSQKKINECKIFFVIIADGEEIGKKNSLPLYYEFMEHFNVLETFETMYENWKNESLGIKISICTYRKSLILLLGKSRNSGKKCSLILAEQFLFHIFSGRNDKFGTYIIRNVHAHLDENDLFSLDYIFHTDADTKVDPHCLCNLINKIIETGANACCGFVKVDFKNAHRYCNFWNNMQYYQYFGNQLLKRRLEGLLKCVTCLPGCNMMIFAGKPDILHKVLQKFSELPNPNNLLQVVSRTIGTDRFYTQLLLKNGGKIVMSDKAYVYTETPQDIKTFISQRKRWNSNAFSNTIILLISKETNPFNRLNALIDIIDLYFKIFRLANIVGFYMFIRNYGIKEILMVIVLVAPGQLYVLLHSVFWEKNYKIQLLLGWLFNKISNPLLSTYVTTKLMFFLLDFKWGLTIKLKHDAIYKVPKTPLLSGESNNYGSCNGVAIEKIEI